MRILRFSDAVYPDRVGGSWRFLHDTSAGLAGRGHDVHVAVPMAGPGLQEIERIEGFTVYRYGDFSRTSLSPLRNLADLRRLLHRLSGLQWDLLDFHFSWPSAGVFPLPSGMSGVPRNYTFQGPWAEEYLAGLRGVGITATGRRKAAVKALVMKGLESFVLTRCGSVTVLSRYSRENLKRLYARAQGIKVMKGGIDQRWKADHLTRREARGRLGLESSVPTVISVRRLDPRMGLDLLIEAMATLVGTLPGSRLLIVGRGPGGQALQGTVDRLGLQRNVELVGFVPEEKLSLFLRAADLAVMPSVDLEGFGLVSLQAMMNGTPVMGTPLGGNRELIGAMDEKLLFRGLAPDLMGEDMARFFLKREDFPDEEAVKRFYRENYDWENVLDEWESELTALAGSPMPLA